MSLAKMSKILGKEFDASALKAMERELPRDSKMGNVAKMEATIDSLLYPEKTRIWKKCKNDRCNESFATNYRYVAFCSDFCRREVLAQDFGIEVTTEVYRNRPDDLRWGGTEYPLVLPPEALAVMKYLVNQAEEQTGQPILPWSAPEPESEPEKQELPLQTVQDVPDDSLESVLSFVDELLSDSS